MTGNPNRNSTSRPVELQQVGLKCLDTTNADCKTMTSSLFGLIQDKTKLCAFAQSKGVCKCSVSLLKRIHSSCYVRLR